MNSIFKQCTICDKLKLIPNDNYHVCGECSYRLLNLGAFKLFDNIEFITNKENVKIAKTLLMV